MFYHLQSLNTDKSHYFRFFSKVNFLQLKQFIQQTVNLHVNLLGWQTLQTERQLKPKSENLNQDLSNSF